MASSVDAAGYTPRAPFTKASTIVLVALRTSMTTTVWSTMSSAAGSPVWKKTSIFILGSPARRGIGSTNPVSTFPRTNCSSRAISERNGIVVVTPSITKGLEHVLCPHHSLLTGVATHDEFGQKRIVVGRDVI